MDGGSPLTGYTIEQRDALEPAFKFLASLDANTTAFQVFIYLLLLVFASCFQYSYLSQNDNLVLFRQPISKRVMSTIIVSLL